PHAGWGSGRAVERSVPVKTWLLGPVGRRRQFTTIGGTPGRFRSLTELAAVSLAWLRVSLIPFSTPCAAWGLPATAAAPPPSASEPPAALPVAVRPVSAVPAVAIGPAAPSAARTPTMKAVIALAAASIVVLLSLGGAEGVRRQPIRISFGGIGAWGTMCPRPPRSMVIPGSGAGVGAGAGAGAGPAGAGAGRCGTLAGASAAGGTAGGAAAGTRAGDADSSDSVVGADSLETGAVEVPVAADVVRPVGDVAVAIAVTSPA